MIVIKQFQVKAKINQRAYKSFEFDLDSDVYSPPSKMPYGVAIIESTLRFMLTSYGVDLYRGKLLVTLYNPSPIPLEDEGTITVAFFV